MSEEALHETADLVAAFSGRPGYAVARMDYSRDEIVLLWSGEVPAEVARLEGQQPNGVVVRIEADAFSAAEVDEAARLVMARATDDHVRLTWLGPAQDFASVEIATPTDIPESTKSRLAAGLRVPVTWLVDGRAVVAL